MPLVRLPKRLRLPRSLSDDGKALVSVDLAGNTPRPPREAGNVALAGKIRAGDRAARKAFRLQSMSSHSQLAGEIVRQK